MSNPKLICQSPQRLIDGSEVSCNCCEGCYRARLQLRRMQRLYWVNRCRGDFN